MSAAHVISLAKALKLR